MTTQTVAITLSTSSYIQNANGNTVITTGPAVVNAYNSTVVLDFANQQGTLDSTGTAAGDQSAGIFLSIGNVSGQRSTVGNGGGLITGYDYGIFLASHTAVSNPVFVFNSGTIMSRAKTFAIGTNPDTAGIFAGGGTTTTISNGGLIEGGDGIFLQANDAGVQDVVNDAGAVIKGTLNEGGNFYAVKIQDNNNGLQGTGSVFNAGLVSGLIDVAAKYASVTNTSTGTITGGLFALGTGTLALEAGGSFAGGAHFVDGTGYGLNQTLATLMLEAGTTGAIGTLTNPAAYVGFGSVTVQTGADWTVGTAAAMAGFSGVTTISDFGTLNVAGSLSGNTIDMEGSLGAASKVDFTGTNTSTKIVDYATGDQIVVSTLGGTGDNFKDSYNTATNVLTITEYNAAGASIGSSLITVSGAAGVNIATSGSFIELSGPGGDTIVLGNTSLSSTSGSIFIDNGESQTLDNTTGIDTIPVTFGTHGTLGAFNTLDLNGSVSGTNSPYQGTISGFGLNDDIILGPSVLAGDNTIGAVIGDSVSLAYSGSLLTVSELNASGSVIATTTIDVGTGYAANSFVALYGTNGINIETPQTAAEQSFTLVGNGASTEGFTDPTAYAGSLSPGDSIVTGEVVTVQSSPAVMVGIEGPVSNSGTILINGSQVIDAANGAGGSDLTGTGTVVVENGGFFQQNGGSTSNTIAFGADPTSVISELSLNDSVSSFASPILGFGTNDEIFLASNVIPAPAAGSSLSDTYNPTTGALVISETNAGGTIVGTETLDVANTGSLSASSFVLVSTPNGVRIFTGGTELNTSTGNLLANTSGSIVIDRGQAVTLTNTTGVDNLPVVFGTNGTSLSPNVLDLNGTVTGTTSPYQGAISGFGLNDDIILGPSVLPSVTAGEQVSLAYAGSLLTVTELNSSGVSIASTTLNVGTGYSASGFVALLGTNGVNIETPATVDEMELTFNASGTANIETPTDYAGGLAPGSSVVAGETVLIASGTASVTSSAPIAVAPTGTIIVSGASSGLIDTGTLGGTGTVDLVNGGHATIGTDLGTINMGGANAGTTLNFSGSSDLSGTTLETSITNFGTLDTIVIGTVDFAATAGNSLATAFNAATGVLTVTDATTGGTINIDVAPAGSTLSAANYSVSESSAGLVVTENPNAVVTIDNGMSYDIAGTVVSTLAVVFGTHGTSLALNTLDLTGTVTGTNNPYQGSISGFGLNDDIILGPSVLPSVASGDVVTLSYAGSLLTVTELNGSGVSIGSTTLNVGTGYSASSFVALLGADGVNIETPQTVVEQTFTFGPEGAGTGYQGSFEDPTQYKGGLAPGSTIVAGETVVVAQPAQANLNSALTNNGLIVLDGINQNMVANSPISGNGTIEVAAGSVLTLDNPTGTTTNTIAFGGGNSFLTLAGTGTMGFAGVIANIGSGDTIDLTPSFLPTPTSASNIGLSFNSATGVLTISDTVGGSVSTDMLTFSGVVPGTFAAAIGAGGIVITDVPCFAAGTRILTPDGQVAVERLAVGDTVLTARDGATQKIIWAGSRTVDLARHAMPEKVIPVVILAGAFGDGLPERDLKLSPDHALFIDGGLIEAKTLVNGTTVIRDKSLRYVTYHHIELERHDVVLAEGLAAETYLDSGNRQNFDSDAAPLMLHPDFAAASRAGACATLLTDGAIVRAARANLLLRAEALGFTRIDAIDLVVTAGAERIEAMGDRSGNELMFVLPAGTRDIALLSATGVPAELSADPSDRRALGAALTGLALIAGGQRIEIALDDPAHQGFYAIEDGHRWTNGEARIALPAYSGRAVLEVTLHGQAARWQAPLSVTA